MAFRNIITNTNRYREVAKWRDKYQKSQEDLKDSRDRNIELLAKLADQESHKNVYAVSFL